MTRPLAELIRAPEILVMPGIFDGFSARLVERSGFAAAFVSGACLSESRLGRPDVGLLTLAESVEGAGAIAACTGLALIADADTGYGNAVNVYFTVEAFERAGLAGIMIEDQVWPKRCGHMAGKAVIPTAEMVEKVRAAVEARRNHDFVVMARTDAAGPLGLAEAIDRANRYAAAGADLLFADALLSADDIARFTAETEAPVCVNMGFGIRSRATTPLVSARQLQELGVAVVIYPRLLTATAMRGMEAGLEALRQSLASSEVVDRPDLAASFEEINDLMGLPAIEELERRHALS